MAPFRFVAVAALVVSTCGLAALEAKTPQQPAGRRGGPPPASPVEARPGSDDSGVAREEQLKQLVVMLRVKLGDQNFNGAGIIFGRGGDQLYIVTARHVVRQALDTAESVQVRFRWLPGESKEARVLDDSDESLDIAVLAVSGVASLSLPNLAWDALVSPERVKPGAEVVPIGYPDGREWFTPQLRSRVQEVNGQFVEFQGELHAGNSGGALVTDDWGIVSIVSQIRPPTNQSSRIDRAIEKLKEWGYPVMLTEQPAGSSATTAPSGQGRGRGVLLPPINDRTRWRQMTFPPPNGGDVLITSIDGNPACASYNGGGCLWGMNADQVDYTRLIPLVCGEGHRARWGVTGYEDPKHWCSLARQ